METRPTYHVPGREIRPETLRPYCDKDYAQPTADEIRAALRIGGLTGSQAGALLGVDGRTIRKWVGAEREIPYSAWRLLLIYIRAVAPDTAPTSQDQLIGALTIVDQTGQELGRYVKELEEVRAIAREMIARDKRVHIEAHGQLAINIAEDEGLPIYKREDRNGPAETYFTSDIARQQIMVIEDPSSIWTQIPV